MSCHTASECILYAIHTIALNLSAKTGSVSMQVRVYIMCAVLKSSKFIQCFQQTEDKIPLLKSMLTISEANREQCGKLCPLAISWELQNGFLIMKHAKKLKEIRNSSPVAVQSLAQALDMTGGVDSRSGRFDRLYLLW